MRLTFFIITLVFTSIACKKTISTPTQGPLRAGISSGYGVYHIPIEPDLVSVHKGPGISLWHDLDLFSPYDFKIVSYSQYGAGTNSNMFVAKINPEPNREIAVLDTIEYMPVALKYGDIIDSNLIWTSKGATLYYHRSWSMGGQSSNVYEPRWLNMGTRYVGVRIPKDTGYFYGYYEAIVESIGDSLYFKVSDAAIQGEP